MIRLFDKANYDVLSFRRTAFKVSGVFIALGLLLLVFRPLNLSIEFTAGTMVVVSMTDKNVDVEVLRGALESGGVPGAEIQRYGSASDGRFAIRARLQAASGADPGSTQETAAAVQEAIRAALGDGSFITEETDAISPKVGSELRRQAVTALLFGFSVIFLYLWVRYEWRFGLAAVTATIHDVLATLAFLSFLRLEVSLFVVASILLIIGYSLNDTIVTFDRVRENLRKFKRKKLYEVLNRSINETLPRTVLTSATTLAASLALVILGGEVLAGPLLVVTFGIIVGTFSSIFIAAPILMLVEAKWPGDDVRGAKDIGPTVVSTAT